MKFLTENPEVQKMLHAELMGALVDSPESRPVTFDDMMFPEKTPYLEAVVSEILRCAKVAAASSKQSTPHSLAPWYLHTHPDRVLS